MPHWTWLITLLSICGVVLNIRRSRACFIIWIFTNSAWCIYDAHMGAYAQAALFLLYALLAIWGLWEWGLKRPA